jgi:hypothetical protein
MVRELTVCSSTDIKFDPRELEGAPTHCHDLISLLKGLSAQFSENFTALNTFM